LGMGVKSRLTDEAYERHKGRSHRVASSSL
jgi:hypothetical protein